MKTKSDWELETKGILKAELARLNINYIALSEKLQAVGIDETPENLSNKISRGKFSAVFLLQCLCAIGCREIQVKNEK